MVIDVDNLVTLAKIFEQMSQAEPLSDRLWSLKVLAQVENEQDELPEQATLERVQPIANPVIPSTVQPEPKFDPWAFYENMKEEKDKTWEDVSTTRTFYYLLENLLGKKIPKEDMTNWFANNSNAQQYLNNSWFNGSSYLYSEQSYSGSKTENRIYTKPQSNLSEDEAIFFQGYGAIPNLWLYNNIVESKTDVISKNISGFDYVYNALERILAHYKAKMDFYKINSHELIEFFIKENIDKLYSLQKVIKDKPKFLGGGADGVAFSVGNGFVIKFFTDVGAYQQALASAQKLHKNPELAKTEAMIYDVGLIGDISIPKIVDLTIYYYIIEKMTPVLSTDLNSQLDIHIIVRQVIRSVNKFLDKLKNLRSQMADPTNYGNISAEIKPIIESVLEATMLTTSDNIQKLQKRLKLNPNWLRSLIEEIIVKYISGRTDLHLDNLGITGYGELRYFDPAYGEKVKDKINFHDSEALEGNVTVIPK